jgi:hypothetical protein
LFLLDPIYILSRKQSQIAFEWRWSACHVNILVTAQWIITLLRMLVH